MEAIDDEWLRLPSVPLFIDRGSFVFYDILVLLDETYCQGIYESKFKLKKNIYICKKT